MPWRRLMDRYLPNPVSLTLGLGLLALGSDILQGIGAIVVLLSLTTPPIERWEKDLRNLRRTGIKALAEQLRARSPSDLPWERMAQDAGWPEVDVTKPPRHWREERYSSASPAEQRLSDFALEVWASPDIDGPRGALLEFLDDLGDNLARPGAQIWIRNRVLSHHDYFIPMIVHLEIIRSWKLPTASRIAPGKAGIWRLGIWHYT